MKALLVLMMVCSIRSETGIVVNENTIDSRGSYWVYDTEYKDGTEVVVTFDTKGTVIITDDEIIAVNRSGREN